ncbi:MAG: alpha/beta hydrolase-fold protein [Planctomycetes bacterium]|nr:alpha/beta hydrolase-fold protein [Planctomycetota bacterium]
MPEVPSVEKCDYIEPPLSTAAWQLDLHYFTGWSSAKAVVVDPFGKTISTTDFEFEGFGRSRGEYVVRAKIVLRRGDGFFIKGPGGEDRPAEFASDAGLWEAQRIKLLAKLAREGKRTTKRKPRKGLYRPLLRSAWLQDGQFFPAPPEFQVQEERYVTRHIFCQGMDNSFRVKLLLPRRFRGETKTLPICLLNDGQNQWTNEGMLGGWHTDSAYKKSVRAGRTRDIVLCAIDMHPVRSDAYLMPPYGRGHLYARWLAEVLLPTLRKEFPISRDPSEVGIMGSSFGAVSAVYAAYRRFDSIGLVGSLSYSQLSRNPRTLDTTMYAIQKGGMFPFHKLWLDSGQWGTERDARAHRKDGNVPRWRTDSTPYNQYLIELFGDYLGGFSTSRFHGEIFTGACHNETWWRERVGRILEFLYPVF